MLSLAHFLYDILGYFFVFGVYGTCTVFCINMIAMTYAIINNYPLVISKRAINIYNTLTRVMLVVAVFSWAFRI